MKNSIYFNLKFQGVLYACTKNLVNVRSNDNNIFLTDDKSTIRIRRSLMMLLFLISSKMTFAFQPDSIVIYDYSWNLYNANRYHYLLVNKGDKFALYQTYEFSLAQKESFKTKKIGTVSIEKIQSLTNAITDTSFSKLQLQNFGYDSNWIRSNTELLFSYVKDKHEHWTLQQIDYVKQQLSNINNFQNAIKRVIPKDGYYTIAKHWGSVFKAKFYFKSQKPVEVIGDGNPFGMPWLIDNRKSYNPTIPVAFANILPDNKTTNKKRFRYWEHLIPELAKQIYYDKCVNKLTELAVLEFQREINELKAKYKILSAYEYPYSNGYIDNNKQIFNIKLHDTFMLRNLSIDLYLTRVDNTLYSRDSVIRKGNDMVKKVQSIPFIKSYLLEDTSRTLIIKFKDGASINDKVIDGFNKSPDQWKYSDSDIANLKKSDSLSQAYDLNKVNSIKRSIYSNCGCNYRLENSFLMGGIYFQILDKKTDNRSTWIILPDSTIVLWWIDGDGFSNYSYRDLGTDGIGIQEVCKKFAPNGTLAK